MDWEFNFQAERERLAEVVVRSHIYIRRAHGILQLILVTWRRDSIFRLKF